MAGTHTGSGEICVRRDPTMKKKSPESLPLHLGHIETGEHFILPIGALRRHALALGGTGSGKSVMAKAVVEECIRYKLPCIAIDLQGDVVALASHSDYVPTDAVPPSDVTRAKLRERMDVKIWTPGSNIGIPLSFSPSLAIEDQLDQEARIRAIGAIADDVAAAVGDKTEATTVAIFEVLDHADRSGHPCKTLNDIALWLSKAPADLDERIKQVAGKPARMKLVKALLVRTSGANRLLYGMGLPIDPAELLGHRYPGPTHEGRARLSIVYLAHLAPQLQQRFLALLLNSIYRWLLTRNGELQGLLFLDEIADLAPPVSKPPAKTPLMTLLRQARKFGLPCLLATQSPGDIDYKALGQFGTIALGRLSEDAGLSRVSSMLRSAGVDSRAVMKSLAGQRPGEFVVVNNDHLDTPTRIRARWLATEHRLVSETEIRELVTDKDRIRLGGAEKAPSRLCEVA